MCQRKQENTHHQAIILHCCHFIIVKLGLRLVVKPNFSKTWDHYADTGVVNPTFAFVLKSCSPYTTIALNHQQNYSRDSQIKLQGLLKDKSPGSSFCLTGQTNSRMMVRLFFFFISTIKKICQISISPIRPNTTKKHKLKKRNILTWEMQLITDDRAFKDRCDNVQQKCAKTKYNLPTGILNSSEKSGSQ